MYEVQGAVTNAIGVSNFCTLIHTLLYTVKFVPRCLIILMYLFQVCEYAVQRFLHSISFWHRGAATRSRSTVGHSNTTSV